MPPADVPKLVQAVLDGADVAVGSRWIAGGADVAHGAMARASVGLSIILPFYSWAVRCMITPVALSPHGRACWSRFDSKVIMASIVLICWPVPPRPAIGYAKVPYVCVPRTAGESKTGINLWDYLRKGRKYVATTWRHYRAVA